MIGLVIGSRREDGTVVCASSTVCPGVLTPGTRVGGGGGGGGGGLAGDGTTLYTRVHIMPV